jgi:hypothetical protein
MGERVEAGSWRTASYVRKRAGLCRQWLRNASLQLQPDEAMLNPSGADRSMSSAPPPGVASMNMLSDHSEMSTRSPTCERHRDDIAMLAIGALSGCERSELLCHLEHCDYCAALCQELSEVVRALEALTPVAVRTSHFTYRILASCRDLDDMN